jgi:programmed cell death protein 5
MLAKPEKGRGVEGLLMNMARMGQLNGREKIGETELIGLLEQVNKQQQANNRNTTTVKVS